MPVTMHFERENCKYFHFMLKYSQLIGEIIKNGILGILLKVDDEVLKYDSDKLSTNNCCHYIIKKF